MEYQIPIVASGDTDRPIDRLTTVRYTYPKPKQDPVPPRQVTTPISLTEAATNLAHKLQITLKLERVSQQGRRSAVARDLYVKGAAAALGITITHMSRIITGRARPGMQLARKIAETAHCSVDEILAISAAREREDKMKGRTGRKAQPSPTQPKPTAAIPTSVADSVPSLAPLVEPQ